MIDESKGKYKNRNGRDTGVSNLENFAPDATRTKGAVMLQGTGSDVGKSLIVAGLCRLFTRRGFFVLPFKPQNMSNNAAIAADGGEISRAQMLQARACRVESSSEMNPVLLKPQSDRGSQVIVCGRARAVMDANAYIEYRRSLLPDVLDCFKNLRQRADLVIVEGAGSSAEANLREGDIANMGFARAAGVPVVLVADIDRGGSLAAVVGSCKLLPSDDRALLSGYIINKFRGDYAVFAPSIEIIHSHTGLPCLGVLPWFDAASSLPAEDSQALEKRATVHGEAGARHIRVCVLKFSRISNFDDFDPLASEDDVELSFVSPGEPIPGDSDLVILPGTKSLLADLALLRKEGWEIDILAHLRRGGHVLGIGEGYQMLGKQVSDLHHVESVDGLGLLDVTTVMEPEKKPRRFSSKTPDGIDVRGYEIQTGRTTGQDCGRPMLRLDGVPKGAVSENGRVQGCCIHGLFANDSYRTCFLSSFTEGRRSDLRYDETVEGTLNELADLVENHLDISALSAIAGLPTR